MSKLNKLIALCLEHDFDLKIQTMNELICPKALTSLRISKKDGSAEQLIYFTNFESALKKDKIEMDLIAQSAIESVEIYLHHPKKEVKKLFGFIKI